MGTEAMTYMLTGKRRTQAIRALQRGRGPFVAYMQATKPPRKLTALEQLTKNLTAALRRFGERVGEGLAAGLRKNPLDHTMIGATDASVGAWGLAWARPGHFGLLRHSEFGEGLDRNGMKPFPPLSAIHYAGGSREGDLSKWIKGADDES